ncbi:hypothetical protein GPJ56_004744 [Histomonas meleagridis]|uniref:uncharacterized protein n=1 Tax=Histomonas meleagridis TaxID=135588 RepID=UPI003559E57A|nr:hypothetical protein GPJ56_004744 [Histomonas meleagridis]KAH0803089.1 hypothetical protein GO595_004182 [Histomonas meleagridis]
MEPKQITDEQEELNSSYNEAPSTPSLDTSQQAGQEEPNIKETKFEDNLQNPNETNIKSLNETNPQNPSETSHQIPNESNLQNQNENNSQNLNETNLRNQNENNSQNQNENNSQVPSETNSQIPNETNLRNQNENNSQIPNETHHQAPKPEPNKTNSLPPKAQTKKHIPIKSTKRSHPNVADPIPPRLKPLVYHPNTSLTYQALQRKQICGLPQSSISSIVADLRGYIDAAIDNNLFDEACYVQSCIDILKEDSSVHQTELKREITAINRKILEARSELNERLN